MTSIVLPPFSDLAALAPRAERTSSGSTQQQQRPPVRVDILDRSPPLSPTSPALPIALVQDLQPAGISSPPVASGDAASRYEARAARMEPATASMNDKPLRMDF